MKQFLKRRTARDIRNLAIAAVAAGSVVTAGTRAARSPAGLMADAVSEVPSQLARLAEGEAPGAVRAGRHLGFDTYQYPGDEVMLAWRQDNVPYEWVGYYLPAPCHKGRSWVGKRERLVRMGWGMAVIYVGQQTWDREPRGYETTYRTVHRTKYVTKRVKQTVRRNGRRVTRTVRRRVPVKQTVRIPVRVRVDATERPLDDCNAQLVSGTRGAIEADDAVRRTESEGFPHGSVIFLDIERMDRTPQAMRDYYRAWTRRVLADGRYVPGFYAHTHNAERIYADVKAEYLAAGRRGEPPFWIAGGRNFTPDRKPHEVGHAFATTWQGVLDIVQKWNGFTLPIDVNVAAVPNPSSHEHAAD